MFQLVSSLLVLKISSALLWLRRFSDLSHFVLMVSRASFSARLQAAIE